MLSLGIFVTNGVYTYAQTSCDSTSAVVGYDTTDESYADTTQGIVWKYKLNKAQNTENEDFITNLTCTIQNPMILAKTQSIVIPETINGVKVTEIGNNAFKGISMIKNITIADSITRICSEAFSGCSSLETITIGNNVTKMGDNVFYGCKNLKEATFGTGLFEGNIGTYVFSECTSLTTITVNKTGAVTIPEGFALGCTALENVNLVQNINLSSIKIGSNAFKSTAMKELHINAPATIGANAFAECKELASVSFGSDVNLEEGAFEDSCKENSTMQFNGTRNVTLGKNSLKNASCLVGFSKDLTKIVLDSGCFDGTNLETLVLTGKRVLVKKNAFTGLKASVVNFNNTSETEIDGDMFETDNDKCKELNFNSKIVRLAPSELTQNRVFNHAKFLKTVKFKNSVQEIYGTLKGDCYLENVYIYNPRVVSELTKDATCTKTFVCHTYTNGEDAKTKLFKDGGCTYKNIVQNISLSAKTKLIDGDAMTADKIKVSVILTDGAEVELGEGSEADIYGYNWKDKTIQSNMTLLFMGKEWNISLSTVSPTPTQKPKATKAPTPTPYYSVTKTPPKVTVIPNPSGLPIIITEKPEKTPTPTPKNKKATPTPKNKKATPTPKNKKATPTPKNKKATKLTVKNNGKKLSLYKKTSKTEYKTYTNQLSLSTSTNPSSVKVYYQIVKNGKSVNDKLWNVVKKNQKIAFKTQGKYCVYFKFKSKGKNLVQKTTGFYIDNKVPSVNITRKFTIQASDKGSGIKYIKVNGMKVENGYKLQPGNNNITVMDKAGNKKKMNVKY